ncbi:hypothetical protein N184_12795 [Sinorhizobium sp. GL28]|jgi:ribose transport system permease protein|nr:hypothetical protein N184_12795 [Sinorhizobium sp. GL28]
MDSSKVLKVSEPIETAGSKRNWNLQKLGHDYGMFIALVAVVIAATVIYPGFLGWGNISQVLAQNAPLGIVAVGMTIVIINGGFDLSVGAIYAFAGTLAAMVTLSTESVLLGFSAGIASGFVCGFINGFVITVLRVNPFVTTLGTMTLFYGVIRLISDNGPVIIYDEGFQWLGTGSVGIFPIPVLVLLATFALGWLVIHKAAYGRRVFAVGGSKEASRLAGIRVELVQGSTYVICGVLSAVAGCMGASILGVGQGNTGTLLNLQAITVVVVGGTSLLGGEGSVLRTAIGLLIIATLNNIFFSLAVDLNWQGITQGLILIAAVAFEQLLGRVSTK